MDAQTVFLAGTTAAFLAMAVGLAIAATALAERRQVYRLLRTVRDAEISGSDVRQRELATPFVQRLILPALGALSRRTTRFTPGGVIQRLDKELLHAGSPIGWDGARVFALKVAAAIAFGAVTSLVLPVTGLSIVRTVVIAPFVALLGYYLPEWVLRARSGKRQKAIKLALPDALDLMSITVEAGLGFDAAMDRVAREMRGPLGQELHRVIQEMRLGASRSDALRSLAGRTTVPELGSFVLALVQAETLGISVAQVLHVQARELRIRRRQHAEEVAMKLPVKLVFPVVLCIFPALLLVLLGPAAVTIYENVIRRL